MLKIMSDLDDYKNSFLSLFVCIHMAGLLVINAVDSFGLYLGIEVSPISLIIKAFLGLLFVLIAFLYYKEIPSYAYLFFGFSVLVVLFNLFFFPDNTQFPKTIMTFYSSCFPLFVVGALLEDFDLLKRYLYKTSIVCLILIIVLLALKYVMGWFIVNKWGKEGYSMGLGYSFTLPALMFLWRFFEGKKVWDVLAVLCITLAVISFGSRGPLLIIAVFFVIYLCYCAIENEKKHYLLVGSLFLLISLLFANDILSSIGEILKNYGIGGRTVDLVFSDSEDVHLSGRDLLYSQLLQIFENDMFTIRGINAEYQVINFYAHNIFIELLFQFGIIVGGLLILFLLFKILATIKLFNNKSHNVFITLFMVRSVCHLLFSESLWAMPYLWLWIALLYNYMNVNDCCDEE